MALHSSTPRDVSSDASATAATIDYGPNDARAVASIAQVLRALTSAPYDDGRGIARVMIQYAGAERAVFVADPDVEPDSAVAITAGEDHATSIPLAADYAPLTVMHQAARTLQPVVYNAAACNDEFTHDPYMQSHQPAAFLCQPLVHRESLVGLLYLEHPRAADGFAPPQVAVLDVLASQAAAMIAHERQRAHLESVIEERTAALQVEQAERTHIAGELERSLALQEAMLDAVADGILVMKDDDQVIEYNRQFERLWHLSREWGVAFTPEERIAQILRHVRNPDAFVHRMDRMRQIPSSEGYDLVETTDGRIIERYSAPYQVGNIIIGRIWSFRDVTKRLQAEAALRESEERYREVVEGTDDLIVQIDEEGNFTFVNHTAERVFALPAEACLGQSFFDFVHPSDRTRTRQAFTGWIAKGQTSATLENRQISRTGAVRYMLWTTNLHYDRQGNVTTINGIARDITDLKRAEAALRRARDELEIRVKERTAELSQANIALHAEVAERKRIEAALRESQLFLRGFLDYSPAVVFAKDREGRYILVNSRMEESVHLHAGQLLNQTDANLFPDEIAEAMRLKDQEVLETGRAITTETEIPLLDDMHSFLLVKFPIYNDRGAITAIGSIATDITELKRAEEETRAREIEFRALFEHMINGVAYFQVVVDDNGDPVDLIYVEVNEAFEEQTNLKREKIIGKRITETFPGIDRMEPSLIRLYGAVALTGAGIQFEFHFDLLQKWFAVSAYSLRQSYCVTVSEDITERKQAEEALWQERSHLEDMVNQRTRELKSERDRTTAILESLGDAVMVVDMRGVIQYLNPAATLLTGIRLDGVSRARHTWWLWRQVDQHEDIGQMRATVQSGQTWIGELIDRRSDGTHYDAAITVAPLFDPEDLKDPIGFVSVQRDITPLKEAERLKDQFVSNVSHELRTPMSLITMLTGSLEMLYSRLDDERRLEIIRDIREHTRVLSDLIGDVLEISRIDSGRIATDQQAIDLAKLVRDEVAQLAPLAERKEQQLTIKSSKCLLVHGNEGQIRQVLRNLLNNAFKYTPEGGQIVCTCQVIEARSGKQREPGAKTLFRAWPGRGKLMPGRWAALRVTDTGIGIAPSDLTRIFERFYRAKAQGDIPGTGLGLSIAWELIKRHAGHLEVSSIPGTGSNFTVYLPLQEERYGYE